MTMNMIVALVLVGVLGGCHGYSRGAPTGACGPMIPNHGADPQSTDAPYDITVSPTNYKAGDKVTVTITAKDTTKPFKGFFLQARRSGSSVPLGTFSFSAPDTEMQTIRCSAGQYDNNAVSHASSLEKTSKSVMWTSVDGEDVMFHVTVVNSKETFWTGLTSVKLTGDGNNSASGLAQNILVLVGLTVIAFIFRQL